LCHRLFRATPARFGDDDDQHQQQDKRERADADQAVSDADRPVADQEENLVHAAM
jgi:hypothetical protein